MDAFGPIYMIRAGGAGADLTPQLWWALLAASLVVWDTVRQRRWDYALVLATGGVIWTATEVAAQACGVRWMPNREVFGQALHPGVATVLQGLAEGAAVAGTGIFVGDRLLDGRHRMAAVVLLVAVCTGLVVEELGTGSPAGGLVVCSRRNMTAPGSLALLGTLTLATLFFWIRWREHRPRLTVMTITMIVLSTAWTAARVGVGTRWIETAGDGPGGFQRAAPGVSWAALGFDVVVEISLVYAAFFAIPAMLGWIGHRPLTRSDDL